MLTGDPKCVRRPRAARTQATCDEAIFAEASSRKLNAQMIAEFVEVRFAKASCVAITVAKANAAKAIFAEAQVC